ncbi:MAG TPA: cupin domain-containing protein [Micropepsaceae bacterium]|nr:cupin domain-containing protein [Micropepsaceae bacterium]
MTDAKAALTEFSRTIAPLDAMPLWERAESAMRPGTDCVPRLWRYSAIRPKLLEAARLISKEQAERRVLVLENPRLRGTTFITTTLYAGLQIILPGEIANSHRHTPSALRFLVEGEGGYTVVGGERADMQAGDFIVTPAWSWHAHGNDGNGPVVWMDGLDTPFSRFFGATFRENYAGTENAPARANGESLAAFGANLLPVDYRPEQAAASPLLRYPYERTRSALHRLSHEPPHPAHGFKMRYANPANGGHPFPTMAVFMQLLPAGFAGQAYRSTDGTVFSVVEGSGTVEIAGETFAFAPRDIFVVPSWTSCRLKASDDVVLFSFSDRAAQEALGFWREELCERIP